MTVPVELKVVLPLVVKPTVLTVPIAKPELPTNETVPVLPAKVVMALVPVVKVKTPLVPNNSNAVAAIFWDCVTVPVELNVVFPLVVNPTVLTVPIAKPLFSRKETVPVLPAKVVMALPVLVKVYAPFVPRSSRPVAVIAADWVTEPVELKVVLPLVVKPTVFTVPIAKPELPAKETVPVLPANAVIVLPVLVNVNTPAVPSNSRPAAVMAADWVTVPVELKVVLPLVVKPVALPMVPIAKPLFSTNDTVPVLPAKVVIAFEVLVKV